MICSLVAGVLLQANQEVRRDFLMPVQSVGHLFNDLGKELERVVIVDPKVEGRLVYIHLKNRSYEELYGYLHEAVGIGVIDKNGALTVTDTGSPIAEPMISRDVIQAQISEVMPAMDREAIRKNLLDMLGVQKQLEGARVGGNVTPVLEQQHQIQQFDPTAQIGIRLANEIGVDQLLSLPEYERVVYSTRPTKLQRAWVGNSAAIAKEATEAIRIKQELMVELNIPDKTRRQVVFTDGVATPPPVETISELMVVVKRTNASITLDVQTFSAEGKRVSSAMVTLLGSKRSSARDAEDAKFIDPIVNSLSTRVALTESELSEIAQMRQLSNVDPRRHASREELEWLSHIDEKEPLSGVVSKLFDQTMEGLGREAVLQVSGDTLYPVSGKEMPLNRLARVLLSAVPHDRLTDKSKVLVSSSVGGMDRLWVPRRAKAELARRLLKNGKLTLWDLSDLSLMLSDRMQLSAFINYALNIAGQSTGNNLIERGGLAEMLLFSYARLPQNDQRLIASTDGLMARVDRLPAALPNLFGQVVRSTEMAGAKVNTYTFGNNGEMIPVPPAGWPEGVALSNWMEEQTAFLTLPVFSPFSLKMHLSEKQGVMVEETINERIVRKSFLGLEDLANLLAKREVGAQQGFNSGSELTGFADSQVVQVSMTILAGDMAAANREFSFLASPMGALGGRDSLPEGTRTELERLMVVARERFENMKFSAPTGKGTPPP